jgi:hypothetical protein
MKMPKRVAFSFLNLKLIGIPVSDQQNQVIDSNGNIMGYEAAKSHYVLYETDQTVVALLILVTTK